VFAISPVKKWRKRFSEGRTSLYDDPGCGRPLTNDLAEVISSTLKKRPYFSCHVLRWYFRIAKGDCLRILHDTLGMKSSVSVGFSIPWTRIRTPKESLYHMEFFRYYKAFVRLVSRVLALEMNHDSLCTFYIIPRDSIWRRHEINCQKESVREITQKSVYFHFFGL
jgi:hypothetical protein